MGNKNTKLKPELLAELKQKTAYSEKEINKWYNQFHNDFPAGLITQDEYKKNYEKFVPNGDDFGLHLFNSIDSNKDGKIDFKEFIFMLNISKNGKLEDKIKWAFKIFDINTDGSITRSEMIIILAALYKTIKNSLNSEQIKDNEFTPEKHVDEVFADIDKNHDSLITLDEFLEGVKKNPWIYNILNV
jgi:Ca2+-binding EF-hand superfamily protein